MQRVRRECAEPAHGRPGHIAGQASVTANGRNLLVTTTNAAGANHSAINWQSFSVGAGYSTYFQQPNATSTSINRVVTNNPSQVFGTLGSNGKLVLVNPSGIAVGAGAVVDTAGFTASTLKMTDADALAGRMRFEADAASAAVNVQGQVVSRGGDVVLIAPDVQVGSQALVQSQGGAVVLAAGRKVEITGRGLEGINLQVQAPTDSAINLGTLQGDAVAIFAGTLRHSGAIQAQAASLEGGRVILKAQQDAQVGAGATINADGGAGKGGHVEILGQTVTLQQGASVNASGDSGGGTVLVGGDMQGKNAAIANAKNTNVAAGVTLSADARVNGDGGKVIVWSDDTTHFEGHISARGGQTAGNGGTAETSGKQMLYFGGTADLTAPHGHNGSLLLDPANITVGLSSDINRDGTFGDDITSAGDLDDALADYPGLSPGITGAALASLLNTTDVKLAATDTIRINAPILKIGAPVTTLTLEASTIRIKSTIGSSGGALNLTLNASNTAMLDAGGRYGNGTLNSVSGALTLGAGAAFDQVTLGSNLRVSSGALAIYNGLTLADGTTFNVGKVPIATYGTETIGTPGTAWVQRPGGITTIGSTGTLALGSGLSWVGYGTFNGDTLVNHGTIRNTVATTNIVPVTFVNDGLVENNAGTTNIAPTNFANSGQLRVNAQHLIIAPGSWTNNGTLRMTKGDITLSVYTPLSALSGRIIRAAGNFFVTDTLDLQGGTLDIGSGGIFGGFGLTQLNGGTLLNGTVISTSTGTGTTGIYGPGGWLDGITIGTSMNAVSVSIRNGLKLADGVTLTSQSDLDFSGSQTLSALGTATLLSAPYGSSVGVVTLGGTLTVGSGMLWKGTGSLSLRGGSIVNNGTIDSNVPGQLFDFNSLTVLNNSLIRVSGGVADFSKVTSAPGSTIQNAGGQLTLVGAAWQPGTLRMTAGTTMLDGNLTLSSLSTSISRTGGDVQLWGLLDLQGGTLDIGSGGVFGTGGLNKLYTGTVSNGTLVSGDGASLWSIAGQMTNMTIGSDITMAAKGTVRVNGGLRLGDGVSVDMAGFVFTMPGSQSITTSGTATMHSGAFLFNQTGTGETLTLGSGVTLSDNASVRDHYFRSAAPFRGTFINKGTLSPGGSGAAGTMTVYGDMDTTNGTLRLEQASTSSYDRINVSGTITLGLGTVITRADLAGANYLAGAIFNVLDSIPVDGATAYSGIINGPAPIVAGFDSAITPAPAPVYLQLTAESPAAP